MVHKCPAWFKCIKRYITIVFFFLKLQTYAIQSRVVGKKKKKAVRSLILT